MRAPAWKPEEFESLLQHPELGDDAVAELLPGRSIGAVAVVRQASMPTTGKEWIGRCYPG